MHVIVGVNLNNMHLSSGIIIYPLIHLFTLGLNTVFFFFNLNLFRIENDRTLQSLWQHQQACHAYGRCVHTF